jgi:hypothetical protein
MMPCGEPVVLGYRKPERIVRNEQSVAAWAAPANRIRPEQRNDEQGRQSGR